MKKILRRAALNFCAIALCGILSGCQFLSQLLLQDYNLNTTDTTINTSLYKGEKSKTLTITDEGTVYFVKYNNSKTTVSGKYTGYVSNSRAEEVLENEEIKNSIERDPESLYNDNELINQMNAQLIALTNQISKERGAIVNVEDAVRNSTASVGNTRTFNLLIYEYNKITGALKDQYTKPFTGTCKAVGKHCNVWFVDNTKYCKASDLDFSSLATKFDQIYEKETSIMGNTEYSTHPENYIAACDKVQIVLCDCLGDAYEKQVSGTFGYQSIADLYTKKYIQSLPETWGWSKIVSNEDYIIYLDSLFYSYKGKTTGKTASNPGGYDAQDYIFSTIPHEFNHLLNNIQKYIKNDIKDGMETWFTEMLSLITEDLFMENLGISEIASARGRLSIFDESYNYGFTNWGTGDDVYYSYANVFAYGAYLCRNYGGEKLIKQIAQNNYVNGDAITKALQSCGYSKTFEETLKEFAWVLINTTSKGITLNKSGTTTTSGLKLSPIDLIITDKDSNGRVINTYKPKIYTKDTINDIYPNAFTIHKIGTNLKSITYYSAISTGKNNIDYYVLCN